MILLYVLMGIVLLVLFLAVIAPKTYDVSRSVEISETKANVFEYLKYLRNQDEWSPWVKRDSHMEQSFSGTDGRVGAVNYWQGNKEVGEGEQEITKIVEGERVETELRFLKPWKSTSDAYLMAEEMDSNTTKVIWGFKGKNKFPMSIFMLFMNMDKIIGKDFEEGLTSLKEILEKQ